MTELEKLAKKNPKLNIPTICPICESQLMINSTHSRIYCPNKSCGNYAHSRICKYLSTMGIMHISTSIVQTLIENGFIKDIPDIYKINWNKVAKLDGFGKTSTDKYKKEIEEHTECTLSEFLSAFNIHDMGYKIIKKMIGDKTLEEVLSAKYSEFITDGIGEITAKKFAQGIKQLKSTILKTSEYVNIYEEEKPVSNKLNGKSFCFTGKIEGYSRTDLENLVIQNGGKISGVSKNLSYLVTDDTSSGSSKNEKAKQLGVKVITSKKFLSLLK